MKLFSFLKTKKRSQVTASYEAYKREILVKQGREQFKKLLDRGLGIPVALA
jgi:hypothetical protein